MSFQTRSAIPASAVGYANTTIARSTVAPDGIAVRPMNLGKVGSTHQVKIYRGTSAEPIDVTGWSLTALPQTVPASLWGAPPVPFSQIPTRPSAEMIGGHLVGLSVTAPTPTLGASRGPIVIDPLRAEPLSPAGRAPLSASETASLDYVPVADPTTVGRIAQAMDTPAKQGRDALFAVLTGARLFSGVNGDVTRLARNAGHLYADPPLSQP